MTDQLRVLTIGHSNHSWERFLGLLSSARITAIGDVRSSPYSRRVPHFDQRELRPALKNAGISYVFLGKQLGGRPTDKALFSEGVADYESMALQPVFEEGLSRVIEGATRFRIALMCSEHEPLDCHRCLLVGRRLAERHIDVAHVLPDGRIEGHRDTEERLLKIEGQSWADLFMSPSERLRRAYIERSMKVAYTEPSPELSYKDNEL
jgi:uncharacterized protein (DUF488 family)